MDLELARSSSAIARRTARVRRVSGVLLAEGAHPTGVWRRRPGMVDACIVLEEINVLGHVGGDHAGFASLVLVKEDQ